MILGFSTRYVDFHKKKKTWNKISNGDFIKLDLHESAPQFILFKICAYCGKSNSKYSCKDCRKARYCSRKCQKRAWSRGLGGQKEVSYEFSKRFCGTVSSRTNIYFRGFAAHQKYCRRTTIDSMNLKIPRLAWQQNMLSVLVHILENADISSKYFIKSIESFTKREIEKQYGDSKFSVINQIRAGDNAQNWFFSMCFQQYIKYLGVPYAKEIVFFKKQF
eukprot:338585_1